jgi:ribonuclease P protein component
VRRLSRKTDIQRVLRDGRHFHTPFFALHLRKQSSTEEPSGTPRLAVGTAGRFPNAVTRNRARRRLRACGREALDGRRCPWDLLLMARPQLLQTPYQDLLGSLREVLRRAGVIAQALALSV